MNTHGSDASGTDTTGTDGGPMHTGTSDTGTPGTGTPDVTATAAGGRGGVTETAAVADIFGIRSPAVRVAMGFFGVVALAVTIHSTSDDSPVWGWVLLAVAALLLGAACHGVIAVRADPMPVGPAALIAAATLLGVGAGLARITDAGADVMQSGPPIGASVIVLAYLAVRGRVVAAWAVSAAITVVAGVWATMVGMGAVYGVLLTVPGYAIMIMGSLFALMLRPMAANIIALRASGSRQIATEAAVRAAEDVRRQQISGFSRQARPLLEAVAARREFTAEDVVRARLVETSLRDGIRARGLDRAEVRDAVWAARAAGVTVTLLDDGGVDAVDATDREIVRDRLVAALVAELDGRTDGRVVARILPPGRRTVAVISVSGEGRREFDAHGRDVGSVSFPS
ncbi:hypothetical protein [Gordonia sp. NB41Y]|uniref:hypothetical protein n=1 Tax=Gordonia sp. NB41Y TaxID=875808 RepID=UPI00273AD292|nr:hypothetical protein [Gordonia sp. NB41Y]WLP89688.1 hypothetical protein Q9K23_19335 [Gordonia sp. NB41Y]